MSGSDARGVVDRRNVDAGARLDELSASLEGESARFDPEHVALMEAVCEVVGRFLWCPRCSGAGEYAPDCELDDVLEISVKCADCDGTGQHPAYRALTTYREGRLT